MPRWEYKELTDLDITNIDQVRLAPYTHMAVQFATVRESGKKIIKPEVGDDDLFRITVLAGWYMGENQKDFLVKSSQIAGGSHVSQVGSLALKSSAHSMYRGTRAKTSIGSVRGKSSFGGRR